MGALGLGLVVLAVELKTWKADYARREMGELGSHTHDAAQAIQDSPRHFCDRASLIFRNLEIHGRSSPWCNLALFALHPNLTKPCILQRCRECCMRIIWSCIKPSHSLGDIRSRPYRPSSSSPRRGSRLSIGAIVDCKETIGPTETEESVLGQER